MSRSIAFDGFLIPPSPFLLLWVRWLTIADTQLLQVRRKLSFLKPAPQENNAIAFLTPRG